MRPGKGEAPAAGRRRAVTPSPAPRSVPIIVGHCLSPCVHAICPMFRHRQSGFPSCAARILRGRHLFRLSGIGKVHLKTSCILAGGLSSFFFGRMAGGDESEVRRAPQSPASGGAHNPSANRANSAAPTGAANECPVSRNRPGSAPPRSMVRRQRARRAGGSSHIARYSGAQAAPNNTPQRMPNGSPLHPAKWTEIWPHAARQASKAPNSAAPPQRDAAGCAASCVELRCRVAWLQWHAFECGAGCAGMRRRATPLKRCAFGCMANCAEACRRAAVLRARSIPAPSNSPAPSACGTRKAAAPGASGESQDGSPPTPSAAARHRQTAWSARPMALPGIPGSPGAISSDKVRAGFGALGSFGGVNVCSPLRWVGALVREAGPPTMKACSQAVCMGLCMVGATSTAPGENVSAGWRFSPRRKRRRIPCASPLPRAAAPAAARRIVCREYVRHAHTNAGGSNRKLAPSTCGRSSPAPIANRNNATGSPAAKKDSPARATRNGQAENRQAAGRPTAKKRSSKSAKRSRCGRNFPRGGAFVRPVLRRRVFRERLCCPAHARREPVQMRSPVRARVHFARSGAAMQNLCDRCGA